VELGMDRIEGRLQAFCVISQVQLSPWHEPQPYDGEISAWTRSVTCSGHLAEPDQHDRAVGVDA
jgi:hypothetical protein